VQDTIGEIALKTAEEVAARNNRDVGGNKSAHLF